jgi:hypothetical protein
VGPSPHAETAPCVASFAGCAISTSPSNQPQINLSLSLHPPAISLSPAVRNHSTTRDDVSRSPRDRIHTHT